VNRSCDDSGNGGIGTKPSPTVDAQWIGPD